MKEELVEAEGEIVAALAAGNFKVKLDGGHVVLARIAGKMVKNRIRIVAGDKVVLEIGPYDLRRARIAYRCRE
jgi:translation initiation factor IF-1